MKDIELPPLPDETVFLLEPYAIYGYTEEQMQSYARSAIESALREQAVPDGWVPVTEALLNSQEPWLYEPCWIALPGGEVLKGHYGWRQGRHPDRFYTDDDGDLWALSGGIHVMPISAPAAPISAPKPAQAEQPKSTAWPVADNFESQLQLAEIIAAREAEQPKAAQQEPVGFFFNPPAAPQLSEVSSETTREPMTDEQVDALIRKLGYASLSPGEVAREVERFHHITKKEQQ